MHQSIWSYFDNRAYGWDTFISFNLAEKKVKIACPRFGSYTELIQKLGTDLNWDMVLPPIPTERTIELGAKYMNELMCFPAKITLGSLLEACDLGASKVFMFDSCGECRMKTYWILQQRVLRKLGYDIVIHPITLGRRTASDIRAIDPSIPYWKAWWVTLRFLKAAIKLDAKLWYDIPEETNMPKIGIVGEIYTMLEPAANKRLISKLEKMGALVHNSLPLSYFIFKGLYERGWMKRKDMDMQALKVAKEMTYRYFPKEIGGHGKESIMHTIYYALKHFDGVIHVLPFPCMPESTVAPILDDISQDYHIPVMRLIFDTHTGETGLLTRLEAFVDILKRRKERGK